nr:hypothetical protein [Tanacetum cinerariifolium]
GQENVRVAIGFGVEKRVLRDHQLGLLQCLDHRRSIGDAGHRVGADDPAGLDVPVTHLFEQVDGATPECLIQTAARNRPQVFDKTAIRLNQYRPLTR